MPPRFPTLPRTSIKMRIFLSGCSLLFLLLGLAPLAHAEQQGTNKLPPDVFQSLELLVEAVQTKQAVTLEDVGPLLDFTRHTALTRNDWEVSSLHGATGAYFAYDIAAAVDKIVSYLYHPGLPPSLFHPSVVRSGAWKQEPGVNIPETWNNLVDQDVQAIYGMEMEENTPDVNTGGYYTYSTARLLLMVKQGGEKHLVSISRQTDQSSVGRKGVVLGDDADWNYYYTGEEGLTTGGLGWVNSYIFDSFSVTVLSASRTDPERSRHVMFKWVRAGWSGINMVRPGHVRDGCRRFAQSLTRLMESEQLPSVQAILAMTERVLAMDEQEIERVLTPYVQALRELGQEDPVLSRRSFRSLLENDPLEHYSLDAKQSLIMKEYLKASIGMPALLALSDDPLFLARYAGQ